MIRRLPIIPTIIVLAAAAIMVALGFWQLGRAEEKAEMIASFDSIDQDSDPVRLTAQTSANWRKALQFRRVALNCGTVESIRSTAGTSARGAKGWAHVVKCIDTGLGPIEVALGWSRGTELPDWKGGEVEGILDQNAKIVAEPALSGLDPQARPDPKDLPNNHLAYSGQWFFFAITCLVIFGFAVSARNRRRD